MLLDRCGRERSDWGSGVCAERGGAEAPPLPSRPWSAGRPISLVVRSLLASSLSCVDGRPACSSVYCYPSNLLVAVGPNVEHTVQILQRELVGGIVGGCKQGGGKGGVGGGRGTARGLQVGYGSGEAMGESSDVECTGLHTPAPARPPAHPPGLASMAVEGGCSSSCASSSSSTCSFTKSAIFSSMLPAAAAPQWGAGVRGYGDKCVCGVCWKGGQDKRRSKCPGPHTSRATGGTAAAAASFRPPAPFMRSRVTVMGFVWPMRWLRPMACRSNEGLSEGSQRMMWVPAVSVMPAPPALQQQQQGAG